MNYLKFLFIVIFAVSFSACWSAEEKKTKITETNEATNQQSATNEDDFEKVKERLEKHISESEKKEDSKITDGEQVKPANGAMSPTETLKEFDAATIAKDAERIKQVITTSSLEYFEKEAKNRGMTFKQLVEQPSEIPTVETPEMRNEKITGNKASVEAKNRILGTFDKYPLVKEDGVWKVAYDLYLKQKLEELNTASKP